MKTAAQVSVILISKDRPSYLSDALQSLSVQSHFIKEILLFDTSEIKENVSKIKSLVDQYRVLYYRRPPTFTTSSLRNEGLSIAKGKFLCFLDDDDYLFPDYFAKQLPFLQNGESIVFCNYITIRHSGSIVDVSKLKQKHRWLIFARSLTAQWAFQFGPLSIKNNPFAFITSFVPIVHGAIFRKDAIDKIRFVDQMIFCEDLHFWMLFYKYKLNMTFNSQVLAIYRIHDANWSSLFNLKHNFDFYNMIDLEKSVSGRFNTLLLKLKLFNFSNYGSRFSASARNIFWVELFKKIYLIPFILHVIPYFITLKFQTRQSRKIERI